MDFNPPDPEKIEQALFRLKDAFQAAADADTGSSQRAFQNLSDKFNDLIELQDKLDLSGLESGNIDPMKMLDSAMKVMSAIGGMNKAMADVKREAQSNPSAAEALRELEETLKEESKGMMGSMPGGFPGGGNGPYGEYDADDNNNNPPPRKPQASKPRPKKPGSGDFKL